MAQLGTLLDEALKLPASDRGRIVRELIRSLEGDPAEDAAEVEAAWAEELEHRATRALSGERGVDLDAACDDIETRRRSRT